MAIRTYSERISNTKQVKATFFRNGSDSETSSDWAAIADATSIHRTGNVVDGSKLELKKHRYEPSEIAEVDSVGDVIKVIQNVPSAADQRIKELVANWHALMVTPGERANQFNIIENTKAAANSWALDGAAFDLMSKGQIVTKSYLVKFVDSTQPSKKVLFYIEGLSGAKCVYLKVAVSRNYWLLGYSEQSGDLIVLRMDSEAAC
jgi:hypothetical protein